jgi:hypothetical protein
VLPHFRLPQRTGGAIGQDSDPVEVTVESFSAATTNGGIFLAERILGTAALVVAGGAGNNVVVSSTGSSLRIGTITAPADATVKNENGSLVDNNGSTVNVTGQLVELTGKTGIGSAGDPIETSATDLSATATDVAAVIFVDETDSLTSVFGKTNGSNVTINFTGGPLSFVASTDVLSASGADVTFETTSGCPNCRKGDSSSGSAAM